MRKAEDGRPKAEGGKARGARRWALAAWLFLFPTAYSLQPSACSAEIVAPAESPEHAIVTVTFAPPDDGRQYRAVWSVAPAASHVVGKDPFTLHFAGPRGLYVAEATTVSWIPGRVEETLDVGRERREVRIVAAEPTPPGPSPPAPGPPPTPGPAPRPGTLGALVADAAAREQLAIFYADWATAIRAGEIVKTTGQFREAHKSSALALARAARLPSVAAINAPIDARLMAAIGPADAPLAPATRAALAACLDAIAGEFR